MKNMNPTTTINLTKSPTWIRVYAGEDEYSQYSMGGTCPECAAKVARSHLALKVDGHRSHRFVTVHVNPDNRGEYKCAYCGKEREQDPEWTNLADQVKTLDAAMEVARKAGNEDLYKMLLDQAVIVEKARNEYWSNGPREHAVNVEF